MNLVAQEYGPKKAPTASRFLKVHPERFLVEVRVRCAVKFRYKKTRRSGLLTYFCGPEVNYVNNPRGYCNPQGKQ